MSEYNKTILTNEGIDLARRANKGTATFSLTRGVSSTDNLSGKTVEELQNLTTLPSIQQSVILSDVVNTTDNPDTVLGIRMTFDNQNLKTGYNVHTVGIYAKEPGKNEILYGVATAKTPEYIPDFGEQTLFKFDFLMYLVIGRTDKVTVEVSPDDVYRKRDTYNKTEIDAKVSDAVSKLNNKDAEIFKSLNDYKQENNTYHQNLEQQINRNLDTKADKSTVNQQLGTKADKSTTYTKDEVDNRISPKADKSYVDGELSKRADKATTYTKDEVNSKVDPKADKNYVDGELSKKADKANTYTRNEIESKLSGKANTSDVNARLPLSGGNMNKGAFINWNGGGVNDRSGKIGGFYWQGATDNISIFADENGNDNLDLAIQLGDDNSNHVSFRRADGAEVAAIWSNGHYTGTTDWNNVLNRPDINNANPSVTVINSFDVANVKEGPHQTWPVKQPWLVDQMALHPFAEAINALNINLSTLRTELMNLKRRVDYNSPQGEFNNTTVNVNDFRSTGIYRFANCYIQNGPYPTNNTHWIYLRVTVFDANTVYQTLYEGDNMYGRKSSSPSDWGRWRRYLNEVI